MAKGKVDEVDERAIAAWVAQERAVLHRGVQQQQVDLPPWAYQNWNSMSVCGSPGCACMGLVEAHPLHFPVLALEPAGHVSFYARVSDGPRGKRTVIKPGRYLKKHFPEMSDAEVDYWVGKIKAMVKELKLATTPEEVAWVYTRKGCANDNRSSTGTSPCMRHPNEAYWCGPEYHPTMVYGTGKDGDLAVAYVLDGGSGQMIGRSLVRRSNKAHGRVYGDATMMTALLVKHGYRLDNGTEENGFHKAELLRLEFTVNSKRVLPSTAEAGAPREQKHREHKDEVLLVHPFLDRDYSIVLDGEKLRMWHGSQLTPTQRRVKFHGYSAGAASFPPKCVCCGEYGSEVCRSAPLQLWRLPDGTTVYAHVACMGGRGEAAMVWWGTEDVPDPVVAPNCRSCGLRLHRDMWFVLYGPGNNVLCAFCMLATEDNCAAVTDQDGLTRFMHVGDFRMCPGCFEWYPRTRRSHGTCSVQDADWSSVGMWSWDVDGRCRVWDSNMSTLTHLQMLDGVWEYAEDVQVNYPSDPWHHIARFDGYCRGVVLMWANHGAGSLNPYTFDLDHHTWTVSEAEVNYQQLLEVVGECNVRRAE